MNTIGEDESRRYGWMGGMMRAKTKRGETLRAGGNKAASQKGIKGMIAKEARAKKSVDHFRGCTRRG